MADSFLARAFEGPGGAGQDVPIQDSDAHREFPTGVRAAHAPPGGQAPPQVKLTPGSVAGLLQCNSHLAPAQVRSDTAVIRPPGEQAPCVGVCPALPGNTGVRGPVFSGERQ